MWRVRIVRDRLEITGACLSDGSVFSIRALCFKAEWKSITMPVLVELLSVDSVLNIRCSEEGMSQEIRSATSKRNPKLSHRFLLHLNHSVSVFFVPLFIPLLFLFSFTKAVSAEPTLAPFNSFLIAYELQNFRPVTFTERGQNRHTQICHRDRERQKIKKKAFIWQPEAPNKRKHSASVLAMPLPHHDEICRTDRAGDKWQEGESVCEKCCVGVFGSGVCALDIFFFDFFIFFFANQS